MPVIIGKRLLNVRDAAVYLSISKSQLYNYVNKGVIKSLTIGTSRRFDVLELDAFIEQMKGDQRQK